MVEGGLIMTEVMPKGENVRRAVRWISENLKENANQSLKKLINDAILRFDLSPGDSEFLINFYKENKKEGP
jgi:hypothetical protein